MMTRIPLRVVPLGLLLVACPPPLDIEDLPSKDSTENDRGDRGDSVIIYDDQDSDGYGDPYTARLAEEPLPNTTEVSGDCNDSDAGISPAATEVCDNIDNNCDNHVDEGLPDADSDGICDGQDCDGVQNGEGDGGIRGIYTAIADGKWSDPATWTPESTANAGTVPGRDDEVYISYGVDVIYDTCMSGVVGEVTVQSYQSATTSKPTASLTLERDLEVVESLWIRGNGLLDIGTHHVSGSLLQFGNTSELAYLQRDAGAPGWLDFTEIRIYAEDAALLPIGGSAAGGPNLIGSDTCERLGFGNSFGRESTITIQQDIITDTFFLNASSPNNDVSVSLETDLVLPGNLEFRQDVVIYDNGHDITIGGELTNFTSFSTSSHLGGALLRAGGTLDVHTIDLGRATSGMLLRPGDIVRGDIYLFDLSYATCPELIVQQTDGDHYDLSQGLSIEDSDATISIDCDSDAYYPILLNWDSGLSGGPHDWTLRWKGSHVSELQALIDDGDIVIGSQPDGQTFSSAANVVYDVSDGYTYIAF